MLSTPRRVCRKAVTKPEHTPACEQGQNGVAGQCYLTGHGAAQREAAVSGKVCDVQDGIAQEQCQRHQGIDTAQFQRRL